MASQLISSRPIAPRKLDGETREGVEEEEEEEWN